MRLLKFKILNRISRSTEMLGSVQHRNSLFGKNNKVEEMKMRKGKRQNLKDNAA